MLISKKQQLLFFSLYYFLTTKLLTIYFCIALSLLGHIPQSSPSGISEAEFFTCCIPFVCLTNCIKALKGVKD